MNKILLGLAALLALSACAREPLAIHAYSHDLMHTSWDFQVVARGEKKAATAVEAATAEIDRLDGELAMWQPQSELARANASAGSPEGVTLSAELAECIQLSLNAAEASQGAFDITVGPLTQAWWQARQEKRMLSTAERARGLALLGWREVRLQKGHLLLPRKGMRLDLGGVAKGYAQDRAAAIFKAHGIKSFLMNAGGQVYAAGKKPDGRPWRVGILDPRDTAKVAAVLDLSDAVMSTSGDYEQFSIIQGQRVHHILDPRTGFSVANGVVSVTAILSLDAGEHSGALADLASTSVFVLGQDQGLRYLGAQSTEGVIITEKNGHLSARISPDLRGRLQVTDTDISFPDLAK